MSIQWPFKLLYMGYSMHSSSRTLFLRALFLRALIYASGLLVTVCASTAISGEYYKWVDDKGVVHFSERPPLATTAEKITTRTRVPVKEEAPATNTTGNTEVNATNNNAQVSTLDPNRCNTETARLKNLTSGARIRMLGPNGEPTYLDKSQVEAEIKKSQQAISESCKN